MVIVSALEYLPKTLLIITLRCASAACLRPGYGFTTAFRPKVFAYHGWDDINNYINSGSHCTDPQRCTVRALLTALPDGTWNNSICGYRSSCGPECAIQPRPRYAGVYGFLSAGSDRSGG
jgi:hypothetical protein